MRRSTFSRFLAATQAPSHHHGPIEPAEITCVFAEIPVQVLSLWLMWTRRCLVPSVTCSHGELKVAGWKVWNGCFWTFFTTLLAEFATRDASYYVGFWWITFVVRWCLWYSVIYPLFDSILMTWWIDGCECTSRLVVYSWSSFYALESKAVLVEELTHKDHLVTRSPTGSLLQA